MKARDFEQQFDEGVDITAWLDLSKIRDDKSYQAALKEISGLMEQDPDLGTPEGDRLDAPAMLVQAYEAKHFALSPLSIKDPN